MSSPSLDRRLTKYQPENCCVSPPASAPHLSPSAGDWGDSDDGNCIDFQTQNITIPIFIKILRENPPHDLTKSFLMK